MDPRTRRWLPLAAGIGLMALFFLPTGEIETSWPPYTLQAWAYMEPLVWPFLPMGLLLAAVPWSSEAYRRRMPMAGMLLGGVSLLLFLATQLAGRKAVYGEWFPGELGPANLLEFHLLILIIHFAAAVAMAFSGLVLLARRWQRAHLGLEPAEPALPPVPGPSPGSAPGPSADLPSVHSSGSALPGSSSPGTSSPGSSSPSSPDLSPATSSSPGSPPAPSSASSSSSSSAAQPSAPPKSDLPSFLFTSTSKPEPESPEKAEPPVPPKSETPPAPKPA